MTKKEAIDILENHAQYVPVGYLPALKMAIEALENSGEQKNCKVYARVPLECREYLREAAAKAEIPMSEYLHRLILADMVEKRKTNKVSF